MVTAAELESIYGQCYRHSEHKIGETIRFNDFDFLGDGEEGVIIWIQGPGSRVEGRPSRPIHYILDRLDIATGMPYAVPTSDIIR